MHTPLDIRGNILSFIEITSGRFHDVNILDLLIQNLVISISWIAISAYVLVAIIRKRLYLEHNLYAILQILSVTLFEKAPLNQLF